MTLASLPEGATAEVLKFLGGRTFAENMNGLGLYPSSRVRLLKAGPFSGPLLIEELASGARILIGRGWADKIEICRDPTLG